MSPAQSAVGELFFGVMECLLGQHRSGWSVCDVDPLEFGQGVRFTCISSGQNISISVVVGKDAGISSVEINPSLSVRASFLVNSIVIALEVLRGVK
jgi:hypothetical protein